MRNSLSFVSNMSESADDESVSYSTDRIYAGFGAEGGIFFRTSRTTNLSIAVRLNMIPFLEEEIMTFQDAYTFQEKKVVVNPHGNQNNIEFIIGVHFGVRKNVRSIFLDGGMEPAKQHILRFLPERFDQPSEAFFDYKTALQERCRMRRPLLTNF